MLTPEITPSSASHQERNARFLYATSSEIEEALQQVRADLATKRACSIPDTTHAVIAWIENNLVLENGAHTSNTRIQNRQDRIPSYQPLKDTPVAKFSERVRRLTPPLPFRGFKNDEGFFGIERSDIPVLDDPTTVSVMIRRNIREALGTLNIAQENNEALLSLLHEHTPIALQIDAATLEDLRARISEFAIITYRNGLYLLHDSTEGPSLIKKGVRSAMAPTKPHGTLRPSFTPAMNIQAPQAQCYSLEEIENRDYASLATQMLFALSNTRATIYFRKTQFLNAMNQLTLTTNRSVVMPKIAAQKLLEALRAMGKSGDTNWRKCRIDLIKRLKRGLDEKNEGPNLSLEARARLLDPDSINDMGSERKGTSALNQVTPLPRVASRR